MVEAGVVFDEDVVLPSGAAVPTIDGVDVVELDVVVDVCEGRGVDVELDALRLDGGTPKTHSSDSPETIVYAMAE